MGRNVFLLYVVACLGATSLRAALYIEGWPVDWSIVRELFFAGTPVAASSLDFDAAHLRRPPINVLRGYLKPLYVAYCQEGHAERLAVCQTRYDADRIQRYYGHNSTLQWAYVGMVQELHLDERGYLRRISWQCRDYHSQSTMVDAPMLSQDSEITFDPDAFLEIPEEGFVLFNPDCFLVMPGDDAIASNT